MIKSELHDFIDDYVCQNNSDIQWQTASRYEFYSLRSKANKAEKKGRFFYHQEVFLRYLRQYNRIFNIQGTGTGKSGSIINVAEFYKAHNEGIKRVYVLQPGPPTVKDFKRQIKKLSDPKEYTSLKLRAATTARSEKNNLSRLINEWYSVETYQQFAKRKYNDETIKEEYSDCIIFMDEAHKLRNLEDGSGGAMTEEEADNIYQFLWKVTHLAERSKIIVSSATPMINRTDEFAILANLLLPMDYQLPLNVSDDFYDKVTLAQLEPFLRGKITFIKFLESNIEINNLGQILDQYEHRILMPKNANLKGEPLLAVEKEIVDGEIKDIKIPKEKIQPLVENDYKKFVSQANIYMLEMEDIQLKAYESTLGDSSKFFSNQRQSSVFVFPNSQYGSEGFKNYVEKDEYGNYQFRKKVTYKDEKKITRVTNALNAYFRTDSEENIAKSLANLNLFSCKFKFFIEKELNASKQERPGNSFCYLEYVESSGAILLALILKIFGFEEFTTTIDPFNIRTGKLENMEKRKRFALLTGQSKNIDTTLKLFNSKENRHGEYIQIIIASRLARDGVNIFNVLRGYIMSPGWHEAGMYQALSRFIRADSHDYLIAEEGKKIKVDIYRLAAVRPNETEILYKKGKNKACIDIKNYLDSEEKNIKTKRIIRFMKQVAFDAYLNYARNTSSDIIPYSAASDYNVRFYKIWKARGLPNNDKRIGIADNQGPNEEELIFNTYNLFYAQKNIEAVKAKIIDILQIRFYISLSELERELIKNKIIFSQYIIFQAIYDLVYNNETISNYANTLLYRLFIKGDIIYMKRENLAKNTRLCTENNIYFTQTFSAIQRKVKGIDDGEEYERKVAFLSEKSDQEITEYYIKTQNYVFFKRLLEDSLIALKNNNLTELNKKILKLFKNYYLVTKKPIAYLEAAQAALTTITQGQGRKRMAGSEAGLKKLDLEKVENKEGKEKVYVHFYKASEKTAFAITSILESSQRTIQILEEDQFKEADAAQSFVYNYLFTKMYDVIMAPYRKVKYYGTYILRGSEDEEFVEDKKKNFFRIVDNSNPRNKGIICRFLTPTSNIVKIIKYLDKDKKYENFYEGKARKNDLCDSLLALFKENNLLFTSF